STKATAAGIIAHNGMLPSRRTGSVIELTDDDDEVQVVSHSPVPVTKKPMPLPLTPAKKILEIPEVLEALETPLRQKNLPNKPAKTQMTPEVTKSGPLSDLGVYVIPTG